MEDERKWKAEEVEGEDDEDECEWAAAGVDAGVCEYEAAVGDVTDTDRPGDILSERDEVADEFGADKDGGYMRDEGISRLIGQSGV